LTDVLPDSSLLQFKAFLVYCLNEVGLMEAPMLLFFERWNMPLALLHCVFIDSQMFHSACNKLPIEQNVPQHGRKRLTLMNNVVK
jgi:hypothetical protein